MRPWGPGAPDGSSSVGLYISPVSAPAGGTKWAAGAAEGPAPGVLGAEVSLLLCRDRDLDRSFFRFFFLSLPEDSDDDSEDDPEDPLEEPDDEDEDGGFRRPERFALTPAGTLCPM
mmetsp:Transcript_11998/g.26557  ORF Transcript_11998/g.26557 Transcript_11998/m.26557 type:complete len:116 (-) Transcript_11998:572-919(-)